MSHNGSIHEDGRHVNSCDFCERPTTNGANESGETLCRQCHLDDLERFKRLGLDQAVESARKALPANVQVRLAKAVKLVEAGHVYRRLGHGWLVKSQSSERVYYVNAAGCQCVDAQMRAPVLGRVPACKHRLAVWLVQRAETNYQQHLGRKRRQAHALMAFQAEISATSVEAA